MAYPDPWPRQLNVGSRVIAQYIEVGKSRPPLYYAGIVAEEPKYLNQYRYLIFFDDGYAQYCTHDQVYDTILIQLKLDPSNSVFHSSSSCFCSLIISFH